MKFDEMTLGELLAVDRSKLTPAQRIDWGMAVESKSASTTSSQQASPIDDWTEGVTTDGRRYLQDPKFPKNVKWLSPDAPILRDTKGGIKRYDTESNALVPVPGGEKEAEAPAKPQTVNVGGSEYILTPDDNAPSGYRLELLMDKTKAPGYQAPTPPQGPAYSSTQAGMEQAHQNQLKQIKAAADAEGEAAVKKELALVEAGLKELPAATRDAQAALDRIAAKEKFDRDKELADYTAAQAKELAGEQSRLRVQEFETTEKPYKEEDLRLKREASDLARGQAQAGVLAKQAEAGQEMVKSMVGWAAPSIETVRAAYSPLQTALRILNSGTRTATTPPSVTAPPPIQPAPNPVQEVPNGYLQGR